MAITKIKTTIPAITEPAPAAVEETAVVKVEDEMKEPLTPVTESTATGTDLGTPPPISNESVPFEKWVNGWAVRTIEGKMEVEESANRPDGMEASKYGVFYMGREGDPNRILVTIVPMAAPERELKPEEPAAPETPQAAADMGTEATTMEGPVDAEASAEETPM